MKGARIIIHCIKRGGKITVFSGEEVFAREIIGVDFGYSFMIFFFIKKYALTRMF